MARALRNQGGGLIEIAADDDAFPLDIRSWCRSSGSELVGVTSSDHGVHHAVVRIPNLGGVERPSPVAVVPEPAPTPAAAEPSDTLDCRGMQCPQPILEVARRARTLGTGVFEVVADDPAFKLDLNSWARSSGSQVQWLEDGSILRARVELATRRKTKTKPRAPAPQLAPVPAPADPSAETSSDPDEPGLDISLTNLDDSQRIARLEAIGASLTPGERVRIRCQGSSFTTPLLRWAAEAGHDVLSFDARTDTVMELRASATPPGAATVTSSSALEVIQTGNRCTLLVLHNDKEALLAALLVANGAAAQGMDVVLFFTFWGLNLLRGDEPNTTMPKEKVSWMQKMMKYGGVAAFVESAGKSSMSLMF